MINEMGFSTYHEIIADELRAALRRYFEQWDEILDEPAAARPLYDSTIEQYRISVIILSAILVEYSINFYLSTKYDAKTFKGSERKKTLSEKWAKVPKQFLPAYELPPKLAEDLSKLIERRNMIVHPKPAMSIDGDNRHQGNHPPVTLDENDFICRCAGLSLRLVENLLQFDRKGFSELDIVLRIPCSMVAGECSNWEENNKRRASYPQELIREIMRQGYSRKMANICAIQFRHKPPALEKVECIIVKFMGGEEIARLKPLKFYNMA